MNSVIKIKINIEKLLRTLFFYKKQHAALLFIFFFLLLFYRGIELHVYETYKLTVSSLKYQVESFS